MKQSLFLLLSFILMTTVLPASTLSINVADDNGGYYRPGHWFPIILSISNQPGGSGKDEAFTGRAIVETASKTSNQGSYQFVREISVPVSSQKRFVLFAKIPEGQAGAVKVTIRRANNQLVQEIPVSVAPLVSSDVFTLIVSPDLQRLNLPLLRASTANTRKQAIRSPDYLQEHWAGYDGANMVIFPSWPAGRMTSKSITALREWVAAGGTLVMLGGSETSTYQDEAALEFLPVSLQGSTIAKYNRDLLRFDRLETPQDESVILSESTPLEGCMVVSEGSGGLGQALPLATVREIGRGKVVFFAVDFKTTNRGYQDLVNPAWFAITPLTSHLDWKNGFVQVVNDKLLYVTGRSARPPSAVLIILICILYTLVVGPINFFLLSKTQRIQWAWFTVPIIVFVFSGLIYGLGTITKGGKTIARESSLYLGKQNSKDFSVEGFLGVLTPKATDLRITPKIDSHVISDHDRWYELDSLFGFVTQLGDPGAITLNDDKPVIETTDTGISVSDWPLKTFGFKRFAIQGNEQLEGSFDSTLSYGSSEQLQSVWLEGDLVNNLGVEFSDSALFFGTYGLPLGAFAANETRSLVKEGTVMNLGTNFYTNSWTPVLEAALKVADSEENEVNDAGINNFNSLRLANGIFNQEKLSEILPSTKGKLYFVGITESADLSVSINLKPDEGTRSKLFVIELNPVPTSGNFWVPEQFVRVVLQSWDKLGSVGGDFGFVSTNTGMALEMNQYSAVFVTELPFHGSRIQTNAVVNKFQLENNPKLQTVTSGLLSVGPSSDPIIFGSQPILNKNSQWFTPYNGRGWLMIVSDVPRDAEGKEIPSDVFGEDRATRIKRIGFSVLGTRE